MFIGVNEKFENPIFEGTEANLYIKGDYLYKIYINSNSSILHLMNLINMQKYIKRTVFLDAILYSKMNGLGDELTNYKLLGCRIRYFKEYVTLNKITVPLNEKLKILEEIIVTLKELLDNNIYPEDLSISSILVGKDIKIIDLDTFDTKITNYEDKELYYFVLKVFRNVLLRTIYEDFDEKRNLYNLEEFLYSKNLGANIIKDITREMFDFKDAENLIYSLKK